MTQDERMVRIRRMATDLIGFHALLENETATRPGSSILARDRGRRKPVS